MDEASEVEADEFASKALSVSLPLSGSRWVTGWRSPCWCCCCSTVGAGSLSMGGLEASVEASVVEMTGGGGPLSTAADMEGGRVARS
jgi:hypothetical protein